MTPERISELQELCAKATEGPWEIALITRFTCSADASFIAAARTALPELLAELTRLTRERDEAYEAGMREAGSIATLEPDLHVKSEYQAGYEQGRNAASVAIYERATAIRALRKPKTGGE